MSSEAICKEVGGMIPAYALGALDSDERSFVEAHLNRCPRCLSVLDEYQRVAEGLLQAAPTEAPPAQLRDRLIRSLDVSSPAPSRAPAPRVGFGPRAMRLAFGLGLVLLVAVNLMLLARVDQLVDEQQALRAQIERNQTAMAVLTYPATREVEFETASVFGTVTYDPTRQVAVLYAWGLETLPAGRAYQAWFRAPSGERVSGGLFQAEPGGQFSLAILHAPEPIEAFSGLGVTVEPSGGSPAPTGEPVLSTDL